MRLVFNASGKKQLVGEAVIDRTSAAKGDSPQALDDQRAMSAKQAPDELTRAWIECGNFPAAEIPNQDVVAEMSKIARRHGNAPRSIHPRTVLQAHEKMAAAVEFIHVQSGLQLMMEI